jgi:hypothetical protein
MLSCHALRSARSGAIRWTVLAVVALLAIGGGLAWYFLRPRPFSAAQVASLLERRNIGISLLENAETESACRVFAQLADELPDETMPVQNLAVARLSPLENSEFSPSAIDQARQAVETFLQRQPDSPVANYLAARFLANLPAADEDDRARKMVELLEKALAADPQRLAYHVLIFDATRYVADERLRERGREALRAAYQLQPDNLNLLHEWITLQVERKDTSIRDTLQSAQQLLGPLRLSIQAGDNLHRDDEASALNVDIDQLITQSISAVEAGDWATVAQAVGSIKNGILPLKAHHQDQAETIKVHPLEFVDYDFSPRFYRRYPQPEPDPALPARVKLEAAPDAWQIPAGAAVLDMAIADFNLDESWDVVVLREQELSVYGTRKRDNPLAADEPRWTLLLSLAVPAGSRRVLLGDLDNDHKSALPLPDNRPDPPCRRKADVDVVVCGEYGVLVLENFWNAADGTRSLRPYPVPDNLVQPAGVTSAVLADIDHDADLDLVIASRTGMRVWSGRGDGQFEDVSAWSKLPDSDSIASLDIVDWNRDVDLDVMVAGAGSTGPGYLANLLHGHLAWESLDGSAAEYPLAQALAVVTADFDGNASWDLATAGPQGVHVAYTTTAVAGQVQHRKTVQLSQRDHQHLAVGDLNNDGYPDITAWGASGIEVFFGQPHLSFAAAADAWSGTAAGLGNGLLFDVDEDGDLDFLVVHDQQLRVFANQGGNQHHWLSLRAVGQCDNAGCVAHTGIGSLLEVRTGNQYQAQVVRGEVTHFGLGRHARADALRIVWTNGVPQIIISPIADQALCEVMTLKGSCPYLYTWTGEKYEFFTDCLWAAPLGMQVAPGVQAPSRSWEYLRIPGQRLKPHGDRYSIQVTEELWEAAYFDSIRLLAVDHPADVEIYSNEKVGPPDIAGFKIHTVRERRRPAAARDQQGRDVLALVAQEDDEYLKAWQLPISQGLTEEHFLELELEPEPELERAPRTLSDPPSIMLYLTGWIYPANTSLNLAFARNPQVDAPRFPEVWTPDADGSWQRRTAFMGFPGGKTKTIAVDLSQAFPAADYRVRIVTTAQIYWDAAFFTADEPPAEVRVTELPLRAADLHYRGFSARVPYQNNRPERYVYDQTSRGPRWPPMNGNFTRYGDVAELLSAEDDRLVVLGAGDEMTVHFAAAGPPLPEGWTRDFLLHNVGWDKDADLNTVCGQTVEPLPYREMQRYPYLREQGPNSAAYHEYLRTYQTRRQDSAGFWRQMQRQAGSAVESAAPIVIPE